MEMEYKDPAKRGKFIVVVGIVLALVAGGAAFYLINQAQQQAGQGELQKTAVVVAIRAIPARKPVEAGDVDVRQVPIDGTNSRRIRDQDARGRHRAGAGRDGPQGQMLTQNMLASSTTRRTVLDPRAGRVRRPRLRGVASRSDHGCRQSRSRRHDRSPGMTVDVLMSATVNVPADVALRGRYYTDKSTKITYQNMRDPGPNRPVLHRPGAARRRGGDHPSDALRVTPRSAW